MRTVVALIVASFTLQSHAAESPSFIIIYADDLGYADTSVQMMNDDPCTKHDFIQTPGLQRLAKMGARFTAAYAPTPTCTGSRLSLQMGKTSARLQYRNVFDVLSHFQRPDGYDDEVTMAEMLKASGRNYITAMFGKGCSTMGRFDEAGYDITDEIPGEAGGNGNGHGSYWDVKNKTPFPPDNPKRIHSLRRDSVAFVNQYAGKQLFFMMVSHYAPHVPHMATDEAFERVKLFNIKTDYREEYDLASNMPEKVAEMDAIRRKYVKEVNGGTIEQVRQALYDLMDEFSKRSKEAFKKDLAKLKEQNPPDFEAQKTAMLKKLNDKLIKNEINKEKYRRHASFNSWKEGAPKADAKQAVRDRWVDVTE